VTDDLDVLGYRGASVVVVGCASGIGEATAGILGMLGARVHAVSLHEPTVAHDSFHPTDLADVGQIEHTASALQALGPIDHLFCASGVPVTRDPATIVRVNYVGVRHLVERALPALRDGGNVAVVASNVAHGWDARLPELRDLLDIDDPEQAMRWVATHPAVIADGYRISKQLLVAWIATCAADLASNRRIRVNCTGPGPTATPLVDETTAYVGDGFFDRYPYPVLGRISTPEEQAWPLVLLSSRRNAVVNGTLLYAYQGVTEGSAMGTVDRGH
jgi:NAD(P)-dependent dehydrogenase (short-subunit alcohol dehydrogenase family)